MFGELAGIIVGAFFIANASLIYINGATAHAD
jgi:hypothetical protein